MPKTTEKEVRYEDSAKVFTDLSGWGCTECNRYWGNDADAEHMARWCCATSLPCDGDGCEGRARKHYTKCESCIVRGMRERYLAKTEVEWDGSFPVVIDGDRYFFDIDHLEEELRDRCFENGGPIALESLNLELCERSRPPYFEMNDYLCDHLPDGHDVTHESVGINKTVNDWIAKNASDVWETNGQRPSIASVLRHLDDDWDKVED